MSKFTNTDQKCVVSLRFGADLHHLVTQKAGGSDEPCNLMPLMRNHHQEIHWMGLNRFIEKYPHVRLWLLDNGWTFDYSRHKWTPPIDARRKLK